MISCGRRCWLIGVLCDSKNFYYWPQYSSIVSSTTVSSTKFELSIPYHIHSWHSSENELFSTNAACWFLLVWFVSQFHPQWEEFFCFQNWRVVEINCTRFHQCSRNWPHNSRHKIKLLSWPWSACGQQHNAMLNREMRSKKNII